MTQLHSQRTVFLLICCTGDAIQPLAKYRLSTGCIEVKLNAIKPRQNSTTQATNKPNMLSVCVNDNYSSLYGLEVILKLGIWLYHLVPRLVENTYKPSS